MWGAGLPLSLLKDLAANDPEYLAPLHARVPVVDATLPKIEPVALNELRKYPKIDRFCLSSTPLGDLVVLEVFWLM